MSFKGYFKDIFYTYKFIDKLYKKCYTYVNTKTLKKGFYNYESENKKSRKYVNWPMGIK